MNMNSLTTVGGTVVDAEDVDGVDVTSRLDHVRRVRSADDRFGVVGDGDDGSIRRRTMERTNDIEGHLTSTATAPGAKTLPVASLPRVSLGRHRSAPVRRVINDKTELGFPPPRPEYSSAARRPSPRSSPRFRKSAIPLPEVRDPALISQSSSDAASNEKSSKVLPSAHPLSPSALATKRAILQDLRRLSQKKPYARSPYFARIFMQGMNNVDRCNEELLDLNDALRICFDINDDMARAIAADAENIRSDFDKKSGPRVPRKGMSVDNLNENTRSKPMRQQTSHRLKPWEISDNYNNLLPRKDRTMSSGSALASSVEFEPTDLSGYTRKDQILGSMQGSSESHAAVNQLPFIANNCKGIKTPKPCPSPALLSPLPPTPPTPGKFPPQSSDTWVGATYPNGHSSTHSSSLPARSLELTLNDRREEARQRVQQYLERIDDKIRHVKAGHTVGSATRQAQSSGVLAAMQQEQVSWPSVSSDGMRTALMADEKETQDLTKMKLYMPTLESPGWEQTSNSVFRANTSVNELAAMGGTLGSLPTDVSNVHIVNAQQMEVAPRYRNEHSNSIFSPPYEQLCWAGSSIDAKTPEQKIREAEKTAGLQSLQEYKELLEEKTSEMEKLQKRYKKQLEQNEHDLECRDEEIQQFNTAVKEAERAVTALEVTIQQLEEASCEKDDLIKKLSARVMELEQDLQGSNNLHLQQEAKHLEAARMLNDSISQMNAAINEKNGTINSLLSKTRQIEAELAVMMSKFESSQASVADAQKLISQKEERIKVSDEELKSIKDMLHSQMELYKNEIATSLENTTRVLGLMTKEKDSLIESLNAKILVLEQALAEAEEEKEKGNSRYGEKEKELNEKIRVLTQALTEKDCAIQSHKEIRSSKKQTTAKKTQTDQLVWNKRAQATQTTQTTPRRERKNLEGKGTNLRDNTRPRPRSPHSKLLKKHDPMGEKHSRRHQKQRQRGTKMSVPMGYHTEPEGFFLRSNYFEDARDDEVIYDKMSMGSARHPIVNNTSAEDSIFDFS